MEDINGSVEQLKVVYKAQTEAYMEFNLALINLISNQKEMLKTIESLKLFSEEEFKKMSSEHNQLEKILNTLQNSQKRRDEKLDSSCDVFKETINNFNSGIEDIQEDVKTVKSLQWDFKNNWNRLLWTIGAIISFLTFVQLITGKPITDWFK